VAPRREQLLELEAGEELLAVSRASFRGAAAASTRATFSLGSGRVRMRAYDAWHDLAIASGFPFVPPDMVIAVTARRLLLGRPTFWGRAPSAYSSEVDLARIAQVAAVRHGLVTGVAFGFTHGAIVEVEALRGRRLRHVVEVLDDLLKHR
jgi:hypothetical protein